ncbi:MAG: glycoside hydrolase family 2 protein [Anaerolineae bacterium]|nr:glycoside hydrolase family 2 protein [Anaerolineae bacterium]
MRIVRSFNDGWLFSPALQDHHTPDSAFERITLPHSNRRFSYYAVDSADYQFVSTYRRHFTLPVLPQDADQKARVFLDFDGVMLVATVSVNGALCGVHQGGFTPFSMDITDHLAAGDNLLTVVVDSTENPCIPPYGGLVDYLTFGGIYRDVRLRIVDPCHIVSLFPRPCQVLTSPRLDCDLHLTAADASAEIELLLQDPQGLVVAWQSCPADAETLTASFDSLPAVALWTLEAPALYTLTARLSHGGILKDEHSVRFGFRHAEFRADGSFALNGHPLKLFGLNRHQTYPYIGAAAPQHLQALDADILKEDLGCNIVRTSHYPQSPHFLNRCDEIGLLVFEELAGWQHIGDEAWKALALQDLQAMIERDRHHPAIILWGVRINESPDDEDFYGQANWLARRLDPTRQTGGVRNFIQSEFLEDVFTLNDFPEGIQQPRIRPHLITEFAGHMFPTKAWDHEERRVAHALHHARKHDLQMGHPDVAGAIGWCAFDYHTHREFGSGDRICYHGVMDIHRLPKMAAYFYRSQKPPESEIVLYAATQWTMGDRSGGGNNPLTVFSNCDEIEVSIGEAFQGRFLPDREHYPHLPHPPFTVRWAEPYNPWGTPFRDLTVRGYWGGELAAEQKIDSVHTPHALRVTASASHLKADGSDMARVAVQIVDRFGNVLPYQMRVVHVTLQGAAELIGEIPLVLRGGQTAFYVKAGGAPGEAAIHIATAELPAVRLTLGIG